MSDLVARARDEAKLWTVLYRDSLLWKMADEIERLESQLDRFMEKGREAMIVMEASARTIDAYKAVVDAARTQREHHDKDCLCVVCLALGELDGEP